MLPEVTVTLVVPPATERITVGTIKPSPARKGIWFEVKVLIPGPVTLSL